jgi:hypothetical protein
MMLRTVAEEPPNFLLWAMEPELTGRPVRT